MYLNIRIKKDKVKELFELGFGKRPAEELYDLKNDPDQMNNIVYSAEYEEEKNILPDKLAEYLKAHGDPRELGGEMKWIGAPYYAEKDKYPQPSEEAQRALLLKEEYSYINPKP